MKLFNAGQIARELGIQSGNKLNKALEKIGVIERYSNEGIKSKMWRLKPNFEGYGLVEYVPIKIKRSKGEIQELLNMKWTILGRDYLIKYKDRFE